MKEKLAKNPILEDKLIIKYNFLDETEEDKISKRIMFYTLDVIQWKRKLVHCWRCAGNYYMFNSFLRVRVGGELSKCEDITNLVLLRGEKLRTAISEAKFSVFTSEWYASWLLQRILERCLSCYKMV